MGTDRETAPPADFDYAALRALFINCTLTRTPGPSHTAFGTPTLRELVADAP